jgi:hypothetical protein
VTPTRNATLSPANAVAIPTGFDGTDLAALFGSAAGGTGSGIMVGGIAPVYETELVDPLVVPPFTLTVEIHGGIGIGALMGQYGYALSVSLDVAASVVGVGARILQNVKIAASAGGASLVLSGARLICGRRAIALPVAFAVTANAAGFRRIYRLRGQPRTLSAAFNSADLRKGIVPTYKLAAAAGGYAITGGTASMVKGTDTSDPYFANVSLLLDMEGLTLSQALVDRSSQDRSVSSTGGTSLSTSVFKYGQSSIYIPTYNYLNISSTALSTTGAYTIEMWFRLTAASGIQCLLTNDYPSNALLLATSGSEIMITIGGDSHSYTTSGAGITANTWYHVALVGTGGPSYVNTIYLNGYNIGSLAQAPVTTSESILCGAQHGGNHWFNGYFDEIRITNGVARYTAAFTPPTASFPTSGAPIVTSGLTVYLDAGNAASYSGTGTTWTDLSGNGNNGTLVNGVGYSSANGGLLVFDGANDYVSLTNTIQFDNSDFTITGWFKADASQSNAYANVWQSGYANSGPLIDANIDNGLLVCDVRGPAAIDNLVATSFSVNTAQWFNFALVRTGSTVSLYVNGSLASSISGSFSFDVDSPGVVPVIGNGLGNTNNRFFKGSIPVIGAYSRALTAAEITQNFNALRARFGL